MSEDFPRAFELFAESFLQPTFPAEELAKVKTLASVLGVSLKKLEYVFRDHLGVGPKAYINSVRLNAVHRRLKAARPGSVLVADAANDFGFWHMGQFAADYRKLFGENPSATLVASTKS